MNDTKQLEISEVNGRTTIVFRKAVLKGKVSNSEVLNTILIAAKMQAEYYIRKLSNGAPLEPNEVKCLKELSEITKLEVTPKMDAISGLKSISGETIDADTVKSNLYAALVDRLNNSSNTAK